MNYAEESLKLHYEWKGKLQIVPKMTVLNKHELSLAYTPGVAQACLEIQKDTDKSFALTGRWNTVAVVTNGTAVLGLGDIGPEAAMPVMEGKCVLFKAFGGVDAIPLCLRSKNVEEIVNTVALLAGGFGGVNLEDIAAPDCFEIERKLKERCDIPIFHDDQHGTAIVVLAGLTNALKLVNKRPENVRVVFSGAGSAGCAIALLLMANGYNDLIMCDKEGALSGNIAYDNPGHAQIAARTNQGLRRGDLAEMLKGANIFIGVSAAGLVNSQMIASMADNPIVFSLANPVPEIMPEEAAGGGAKIIATGRSDYPNQINNVLAFPGIFRGALDVRARDINEEMKIAAALALANLIPDSDLRENNFIPEAFDPRVKDAVAAAVARAAVSSGVARDAFCGVSHGC